MRASCEHLHPPRRGPGLDGRPSGHRRGLDERQGVVVLAGLPGARLPVRAVAAAGEEGLAAEVVSGTLPRSADRTVQSWTHLTDRAAPGS